MDGGFALLWDIFGTCLALYMTVSAVHGCVCVSCVEFLTALSMWFLNFHSAFLKRVEFVTFAVN